MKNTAHRAAPVAAVAGGVALALAATPAVALAEESAVGADILISFSDLLAGLILLYRCWVIWGKKYWIVLPPFVMALGGFGAPPSPLASR